MKWFTRKILFYMFALFVVSNIIPGFSISLDPRGLFMSSIFMTLAYLIISPILKIVFLPLNALTLGFFSIITNAVVFYIVMRFFPQYFTVNTWQFNGFSFPSLGISIAPMFIGIFLTVIIVAGMVSLTVSILEKLL